nr:putative ribonuclease H-like domain-containing protein [Tanacetum cinerariifolium]
TKDETSGILKSFITRIENLVDRKVKVIRCDNGIEFKNREMNQFWEMKDHLGKFDGKADKGFFVGYSLNSKAFTVFNSRTRIVEENFHIRFSENTPNVVGSRSDWLFDIDARIRTINYEPIVAAFSQDPKSSHDDEYKPSNNDEKKVDEDPRKEDECNEQEKEDNVNSTNNVNTVSSTVDAARTNEDNELPFDPNMPALEDVSIFNFSNDDDDDDDIMADINNMDTTIQVSPILTIRIHKDHSLDQVIGDLHSATQTRQMSKNLEEHGFVCTIQQRTNHKDLQNCLFACFLSQEKPKKVIHALRDPSQIETMQEELLQFKLQNVWTLVDLPNGKRVIDTKWVFKNKKDERGIMIRNKARLVAQGHTQEGINYDDVFAPIARIETIRLFLAYKSFKDFVVYQMDVKSAFLYRKIKEEVYVYVKNASTPMETQKPLLKDEDGEKVDVNMYRLMIGSLMYLTSSRPDVMFAVCVCSIYQDNPNVLHLHAVKMIFRKPTRKVTQVPQPSETMENVTDEAIHKELGDSLVRAATTASSLEAE